MIYDAPVPGTGLDQGDLIDGCPVAIISAFVPGQTVIDRVLSPGEVLVGGRPTLMFGSNNYLGLTLHPEVTDAACRAVLACGTGTTGSRTANGT